ncbi:sulfatase [Negadavirga shengliensis]|uniref:Sulfatase n=1 Tax=Negadavirga shengliensis TaxID=1389218 RepID=A0ABV9SWG1_9BACT
MKLKKVHGLSIKVLLYLLTFTFTGFQQTYPQANIAGTAWESESKNAKKPNMVFLISEDNSKHHMDLFDPNGVPTPHIRTMAEEGLTFIHAFSNSPVCSVARSTLITGTLATRTAMHLHRKIEIAPMPDGLEMFPAYLRKAGYHTTNNAKKDYNAVEGEGVWDESSSRATWKNRKAVDQPFFHKETFMESHESRLHFDRDLMREYQPADEPDSVWLPPYYPDTPTFRFTVAYHRDKIREIDEWVGNVLKELEKDGLLEDTFVFYFGDHGGVLPGSKGYLYETGLHVPLVVRVPENWQHLVQVPQGTEVKGFVSFVDFAPTVLNLAGIPVPDQMDGMPFLGQGIDVRELESRDEAVGYADRFDEKYEMVRSIRKGKWKYIRSFQPFYPDALHNNYRYKMLAFAEWRDMFYDHGLDESQQRFFQSKPVEMLFDLEKDPYELNNLAPVASHQQDLSKMRGMINQKLLESHDLGFLPESVLVTEAIGNPVLFGNRFHHQLDKLITINTWACMPFQEAFEKLSQILESGNSLEIYWALTVASTFGEEAKPLTAKISPLQSAPDNMVKLRAIEFMGIIEQASPYDRLVDLINTAENPVEVLLALNTLVYFRDHSSYEFVLAPDLINPETTNDEVLRRLAYLKGEW